MKRIKVLHISETFAAGVYTYIRDICRFMEESQNVDNYVIYSGLREDTNIDKFPEDFSSNTKLIQINMKREISPFYDIKATRELAKQIKEIKPDAIHLHSSKAGVLGRIAARGYKDAKLYYTPNGYSFVREDISKFKRSIFRLIERGVNKTFGGVTIACGDTEFEHAKKLGKSLLVRNGVNIEEVSQFSKNEKSTDILIGSVGRLSSQKNPAFFNEVAQRFPDVKFIWIGDGELKNLITSENISITGWLTREEVLKQVNTFSIYLQTSLWEGLPFTIIEAMVLKRPVIATNVIGNKDAVYHESNGFLCETVDDFEKSIRALIEDPSLRKEMGKQSFERAKKLFDRDKNFLDLYNIYIS